MDKTVVARWIDEHREEIIAFLQAIVRIPSVTGNEGPIQDFLEGYLQSLGLETDVFVPNLEELRRHPAYVQEAQPYEGRPNLVGVWRGAGGGKSLLFNGHIDVIPEGAAENWQHPCWSANIDEEGRMYGRGTSDMKAGVAAYTMAIRALKACGFAPKGDIIAEYVMDEELTGNGTLACVLKGYEADAGICCETSSMRVQPGSIGRIWFTIKVKGKAAGIQRRYEGVNAIDMGYLVTKVVSDFEKTRVEKVSHPLYPDVLAAIPCMVGRFESGSYNSAFPDSCELRGSLATLPGEDSDKVKREFAEFVREKAAAQSEWLQVAPPEILFAGYFAHPSEIPLNSPIVQTLCSAYQNHFGTPPVISGREGAADIRHLNQYGNTPTVIFGPGKTEQMHANNEWVSVQDYLDAIHILADTIVDWCG